MHWWLPYPKVRWSLALSRRMSKSSAWSKWRSSWFADELTISSFAPAGMATPLIVVSAVTRRRHAATDPE